MIYKHKELGIPISKKEFKSLNESQQSDFINISFEVKKELMYQKYFRHFAMRLLERHDIAITFQEYVYLCGIEYLKNQKLRKPKNRMSFLVGKIKIKEVEVTVYRNRGIYKQLLTVLPKK